jgi:hypothetical protein
MREFAVWTIEMLGYDFTDEGDQGGTIRLSDADSVRFQDQSEISFCWGSEAIGERLPLGFETPLFRWLLDRLQVGGAFHGRPADQPDRVHQITDVLFPAYRVEAGSIRLSGCTLEEKPLVRLSYVQRQHPETIRHILLATNGQPIDEGLVECLSLESLVNYSDKPPRGVTEQVDSWISVCGSVAEKMASEDDLSGELAAVAIVWCKYAAGKLTVSINDQSADVPFAGFAQAIVAGVIPPPPFTCPETGDESFEITATEDDVITTVGSIVECEHSGKSTLKSFLKECAATHKLVLPEFLVTCPASGEKILKSAFIPCPMCQQLVSPTAIRGGKCDTCHALNSVFIDDARIARVLGEYPRLDQWRSWRIAESATSYVIVAAGIFKKVLVVLDKEQLQVNHMATAGLLTRWQEVPAENRSEYLD